MAGAKIVCGDFIRIKSCKWGIGDIGWVVMSIFSDEIGYKVWNGHEFLSKSEVNLLTIGQLVEYKRLGYVRRFTGFRGRDGGEIYEGDLIKTVRVYQKRVWDESDPMRWYSKEVKWGEDIVDGRVWEVFFGEITVYDDYSCPHIVGWNVRGNFNGVEEVESLYELLGNFSRGVDVMVDHGNWREVRVGWELVGSI